VTLLKRHAGSLGLVGFLTAVAASALWLDWPVTALSKQEVIQTALRPVGNDPLTRSRIVGVKLIHREDLPTIIGYADAGNGSPWDRVWVVDLKGMVQAPSFMDLPSTYTVEIIPDRRPAAIEISYEDRPGDRPPQWDSVASLSD
jgi:hypothetical protein